MKFGDYVLIRYNKKMPTMRVYYITILAVRLLILLVWFFFKHILASRLLDNIPPQNKRTLWMSQC